MIKKSIFSLLLLLCSFYIHAQQSADSTGQKRKKGVVFPLNKDGSNYVKFTGLGQVWLRNTQMNPNSAINDVSTDSYTDISIRRLRFQIIAQLTDKVFFYTQFGQNNFNFHSNKYEGAFFHDAVVEYAVAGKKLSLGGGLTAWSGLSRYASPSIGTLMTLDAPLYQQATNGVNDQFVRKLSVYAKGQLGKLDYRIALSQPMTVTGGTNNPVASRFTFNNEPAKKQLQGYFKWMFYDKEGNLTPFNAGTYLGKKKILNLGAGIIYQPEAMWKAKNSGGIDHEDMLLLGVDAFYDAPLTNTTTLTVYAAFTNYNFGEGYFRNVGVNNPATSADGPNVGGYGNAFTMVGNGTTIYTQIGYLMGENIITEGGKIQPFMAIQSSDYDFLDDDMIMYELGFNYLTQGDHSSKFSFMYQSRPAYVNSGGLNLTSERKGMAVLQYQISF